LFGHSPDVTETLELAEEAIAFLESRSDDRSLGRAWLLVAFARGNFQCDNTALEEAGLKAAEHYRRSGWSPSICVGSVAGALLYGPRPVDEAIEICERLLQEHREDRASEAGILVPLGALYAMRGRIDEANAAIDQADRIYEELGQSRAAIACNQVRGEIELLAGRFEVAESKFRASCDACARLHEYAELASRAAELADVLSSLGRDDEAEDWVQTSRDHADESDRHAEASWRSVAAKLLARNGMHAEAETLAREAIRIAEPTDGLNQKAKLSADLAEVLRSRGQEKEAAEALETAVRLYELKGNRVGADHTRGLLIAAGRV
jgi:tetratricopeptide (TPR) repeat protein